MVCDSVYGCLKDRLQTASLDIVSAKQMLSERTFAVQALELDLAVLKAARSQEVEALQSEVKALKAGMHN